MARKTIRELDDILRFYGKESTRGNRIKFRFLYLYRFILTRVTFFCPMVGVRVFLTRLRGVRIGKGVYLGHQIDFDYMFPSKISIEDHAGIGSGCSISAHHSIPMETPLAHIFPREVKPVHIGRGVDCNLNVIIQPGVTIGDYALIGNGAVITRDIPPMTFAAGNPAKPLSDLSEKIRPHIPSDEFEALLRERRRRFNWPPEGKGR
jgi:heptaprenylglycerol acetyltransferase